MSRITSNDSLLDWVKLRLGMPVLAVEVSNAQLINLADDCVDIFSSFAYGFGTDRALAVLTFSAGQTQMSLANGIIDQQTGLPIDNIESICSFETMFSDIGSINSLMTPTSFLLASFSSNGTYNGFPFGALTGGGGAPGSNYQSGGVLANYEIAMQSLVDVSMLFGKSFVLQWVQGSRILKISPTPTESVTGVLSFYRRDNAIEIYNHFLFKKLYISKVKQLWGSILKKYSITMPDGGTITGPEIYNEGREEEKEAMEDLKGMSAPCDFFIA